MIAIRRHPSWLGLGVLPVVALAARLAYAITLPPQIVVTYEADPLTYDQIARNLVAGRGFIGASFYYPPGTEHPTAFWDALYPLFLAALYSVFGYSIPAVRIAQAAVGAIAVALTFLLGRRLAGPAAGIVAAGVSAIYPFFVYYSGQLLTETLFMALILGVFVAGYRARDSGRVAGFALLGVLSGLAALCRAEAFFFGIAFIVWQALNLRRLPFVVRPFRLAFAGLAAMLIVMLPWGIRNQVTHGQVILTTTKLGYNLYKYYHPDMTADQTVPVVPFPEFGERREPEREALLREHGLRFMAENPGRTAWFMANKLALLFKLTPSNEVNRQYALVSLGSYGLLLPFMAAGLILALRRGGDWLPVIAYVAFSVASKVAVFAGIRLRMQIEPFLILLAALALVALWHQVLSSLRASSAGAPSLALPARRTA